MNFTDEELEEIIRKVVAKEIGDKKEQIKIIDKSGVGVVKTEKTKKSKFDTGNLNDEAYITELFTLEESPRMGTGIIEMIKSNFDWRLTYDEIDYIIEGKLEVIIEGRKIIGEKGDVILIPKNTKVTFNVPEFCKFMYVVYPANWAEIK